MLKRLEKLDKSELITLLIEREENRREEKEEMKVGDIMILKHPIKQMGMSKYHEIFQINAQHGDMAFITKLKCIRKYPYHNTYEEDGYDKHVKYDVKFDSNDHSCWEYKNALYENYEKFDKDKMYKL